MTALAFPLSALPPVVWWVQRLRKRRLMVQRDFDDAVSALHLLETDGPSTAGEVAAGTNLTTFRAMQVLDYLEKAGGVSETDGTFTRIEP
jgi:hypothetical protein